MVIHRFQFPYLKKKGEGIDYNSDNVTHPKSGPK